MAEGNRNSQNSGAKKKQGRPHWGKKHFPKHGQKHPQKHAYETQAAGQQSAAAEDSRKPSQKGRFQKHIRHEYRQLFDMVNGRLVRKEGHAQKLNMQLELEKSSRESKADIQTLKQNKKVCALCGEAIDDMLTAIPLCDEEQQLCHFECVQKKLMAQEQLTANESMSYIGNGDFCIVQERRNRGKPYYFFRKRIHYANLDKARKV
jgi:hypothetical protein